MAEDKRQGIKAIMQVQFDEHILQGIINKSPYGDELIIITNKRVYKYSFPLVVDSNILKIE